MAELIKIIKIIPLLALLTLSSACYSKIDDSSSKPDSAEFDSSKVLEVKDYYSPATEKKEYEDIFSEVIIRLSYSHYRSFFLSMSIDDELSEKLFDKYINDLDPEKLFFLKSDIQAFSIHRKKMDDYLAEGKLKPFFDIFNVYQQRMIARYIDILKQDLTKVNFDIDERMLIDRENAEWAADIGEMNEIWRKRIKNSLLAMKLSDEEEKDFTEETKKKYLDRLVRIKQTTSDDAFQVIMDSFTQLYDPHTQFLSSKALEDFNTKMKLSFEGIGAHLQREDGYTKVVRLVAAGPAEKAGELQAGDRIVGVAQGDSGEMVDIIGWRLDNVVDIIRGKKGTVVKLKIIPSDSESDFQTKVISIKRGTVKLEEQAASEKIIEINRDGKTYKIGIIDLPAFYRDFKGMRNGDANFRSSTRDVERLISKLKNEGVDGIVLDLRNNGGGALTESTGLSGLFIKYGPVVQVRNVLSRIKVLEDDDPRIQYKGPLIVLVNRLSASASEIFAGAMQDYNRAIIVGDQTFGKGTVQGLASLEDGAIKITQSKFFRVTGESTQHKGVIPDIQMPSIIDKSEVGESSLDEALPWDTIRSAKFKKLQPLSKYVPELVKKHEKRVKNNPDFQYLVESIEKIQENKKDKTISLSEKERLKEQEEMDNWRLDLENKRRKLKGEEPFKTVKEMDDFKKKKSDKKKASRDAIDTEDDIVLKETAEILVDFIGLSK